MSETITMNVVPAEPEGATSKSVNFADRALGIMAAFALAWGLLGLVSFVFFVTSTPEELMRTYRPEQVAYIMDTPFWVRAGQALGVLGMLTGSVYLLLRRRTAYYWFMWSLVGTLAIVLDGVLRGGFSTMGGMETGVNIAVTVVGIFLFWATYSAYQEGQLGAEARARHGHKV